MSYPFYILLGVLPSIIWLLFYLRQDVHPEPKRLVIKIFFWGMLAAFPAVLLEFGASGLIAELNLSFSISRIAYWFLGVALTEEFLKYLVVRDKILKNPEFNEAVDAMLYMLIAALGFVASENILFSISQKLLSLPVEKTLISLVVFRFLSATLLHALCSAVIGYFLALHFFKKKGWLGSIGLGLGLSTLLHGIYDFSIMEMEGSLRVVIPLATLICLSIFVSLAFKRVKKIRV